MSAPCPEPRPAAEQPPTRGVEITEFDCAKAEDFPPGRQTGTPQRLSQWQAGGPSGASWNATNLKCFADVRAQCARGELRAQLLIGQRAAVGNTFAITVSGPQRIELDVPERTWRRELDAARKPELPYRTALFTLRVEVSCQEPEAHDPVADRYTDVADVRSFVGGFASGE